MNADPLKILVELLCAELVLKPDQVLIYNQQFEMPNDRRLYLCLSILGAKTFAVRNKYEPDPVTGELTEHQGGNRQEMISLLAYSKSPAARERNWEIPLVFTSTFAEQLMEKYSIKIARVPTNMIDVSNRDGASRLFRYSMSFNVLAAYSKVKAVPYYNTFRGPAIVTDPRQTVPVSNEPDFNEPDFNDDDFKTT